MFISFKFITQHAAYIDNAKEVLKRANNLLQSTSETSKSPLPIESIDNDDDDHHDDDDDDDDPDPDPDVDTDGDSAPVMIPYRLTRSYLQPDKWSC